MRFIAALIGSIVAFASADCSLDCLNTCFANGANDCFVTGCGCSETVQAGLKTMVDRAIEEKTKEFQQNIDDMSAGYMQIHDVLESWENLSVEERSDAKDEVLMRAKGWVSPKVEAVENTLNAAHDFIEQGVQMDMEAIGMAEEKMMDIFSGASDQIQEIAGEARDYDRELAEQGHEAVGKIQGAIDQWQALSQDEKLTAAADVMQAMVSRIQPEEHPACIDDSGAPVDCEPRSFMLGTSSSTFTPLGAPMAPPIGATTTTPGATTTSPMNLGTSSATYTPM